MMQITYLFDPLCGWCYGAGPTLERLALRLNVSLSLTPTGLFAHDAARVMDASFAAFAWQNDQRIARLTGQPFSDAYRTRVLGAAGKVFDSAPATLGLIAVGFAAPSQELVALKALQHARYVDGCDSSERSVVADILDDAGFAEAARRVRAPDEDLLRARHRRVQSAQEDMTRFGANGVPALVVGEGPQRRLMRSGMLFGGFEALTTQLRAA
jgi:putative protein-disulfide isomerase